MKPFDLEAAKRGEPLVTRDGRQAFFIAHVPALQPQYRVIFHTNEDGSPTECSEEGTFHADGDECRHDLFMAPQKRTVYVNVYDADAEDSTALEAGAFPSESDALRNAKGNRLKLLATAVPVEIED